MSERKTTARWHAVRSSRARHGVWRHVRRLETRRGERSEHWLAALSIAEGDGAAAHFVGRELPDLTINDAARASHALRALGARLVLFSYPQPGRLARTPHSDPAPGWDAVPGAPEVRCSRWSLWHRDQAERFATLGFGSARRRARVGQ